MLSLRVRTSGDPVQVTAELRGAGGAVTPVSLGEASARARTATARLPAGRHELEALELDVSAGQEATAGHQNAENPAARTQFSTTVSLGPAVARDRRGDRVSVTGLGGWRGVGAAAGARPADRGGAIRVRFAESGQPGVLRPLQPSDRRAIAVLTDPATAAAASSGGSGGGSSGGRRGGLIALTVDGLPVQARIVGVLRRFPTLAPDDAGFIVADEATLAAALDASLPGQGRPDELWIDTRDPRRLDASLRAPPLDRLGHSFRYRVQRALRSEPLATGTLGTLAAAAGLGVALALVGLLAALAGPLREPAVERDLAVLGSATGPAARAPRPDRPGRHLRRGGRRRARVGTDRTRGQRCAGWGDARDASPVAGDRGAVRRARASRVCAGGRPGGRGRPGHWCDGTRGALDVTAEVVYGAGEPAIVLRDVFCVHRSVQGDAAALQGLDLSVAQGERLCVLGPSGAGKSTLLRMIAGLQTPSAGRVQVLGVDAGRLRARERARLRHRSIGFLDQRADSTLAPELRIEQSVALPLALRGASRSRRRARAGALLDAAGLGDRRRALPGELSGGERQRAALCAALAHRPALLLADEPTAELDEGSAVAVVELIEELAVTEGTTVVMVTHDAALAARAQRVVRLHDGRIVEEAGASGRGLVVGRGGWIRIPGSC